MFFFKYILYKCIAFCAQSIAFWWRLRASLALTLATRPGFKCRATYYKGHNHVVYKLYLWSPWVTQATHDLWWFPVQLLARINIHAGWIHIRRNSLTSHLFAQIISDLSSYQFSLWRNKFGIHAMSCPWRHHAMRPLETSRPAISLSMPFISTHLISHSLQRQLTILINFEQIIIEVNGPSMYSMW